MEIDPIVAINELNKFLAMLQDYMNTASSLLLEIMKKMEEIKSKVGCEDEHPTDSKQ